MADKKLSPRWAHICKEERSAHMRALARKRMRKLPRAERVRIARVMVAARRTKRAL